ncbi:hypothetical protein GCM10009821_16510 [Aeromicrobium halocynthiae]|uniref:Uncharacterized protein n=1 Tax=Aeromicrobium halocynthiae TaxID=560557 RepID=A0ABN2VYG3_9ACTN
MLSVHAVALAEARSCLAALADAAASVDSSAYERLLIDLDVITNDVGPATYPIDDVGFDELVERAEHALDSLKTFGVDALSVKLLTERLNGCAPGPQPS